MSGPLLAAVFVAAAIVGYFLIRNVPVLLHTPLMSGMNALSGLTVLGAITAAGFALKTGSRVLGGIAIFLAMINVAGGFGVTIRMLRMFKKGKSGEEEKQ